ncbi:MAG: hypothetical protein GY893_11045 [bacterium]|nr:hypothetical protein [bacterium]
MKTSAIMFLAFFLLISVTQACPTVDPNTTLYWANNFVYDWGTSLADDFLEAFQTWAILASEVGIGSWHCTQLYDWTYCNMWLQWGGGESVDFPFARASWQLGPTGRIISCTVTLDSVYPWWAGDPSLVPSGYPSALAVLTHELGHVFGASHSNDVTSCTSFMNETWEYQLENLPTMASGSQTVTWNWGLFPPHILLHTLAPADLDWVSTEYQGVVEILVTEMSCRIEVDGVTITWVIGSSAGDDMNFVIEGEQDGRKWLIPHQRVGESTWAAHDEIANVIPGSTVDYHLYEDCGFGELLLLNTKTVMIPELDTKQLLISIEPNPFNPSTEIKFNVARPAEVNLTILNVAGEVVRRLVASQTYGRGAHVVTWNGKNEMGIPAASGIYICNVEVDHQVELRAMTLLK